MPSRWADTAEDARADAARKAEKEEKKRAKAEKQRRTQQEAQHIATSNTATTRNEDDRPAKRRRLSHDDAEVFSSTSNNLRRFPSKSWQPCRSVERFERLNHIEEGSYGLVSRAREEATGEIVALKKLKLNPRNDDGVSVTALREIQTLNIAKHRHIVNLREVVVGERAARGDVYLVMDFLEHDLKTLQEEMQEPFMPSEIKTLMLQLGSGLEFLHDNWILHRDLKTSNILMNNRGEIKIADFGMARLCGDPPPKDLTQLVVTLWYRAPELLLGTTVYDSAIDIWSLGCIFGELLAKKPLAAGKNEVNQLSKIFEICGTPTADSWPGFRRLPNARSLRLPTSTQTSQDVLLRARFPSLSTAGVELLSLLLSLNPEQRPTAKEVLTHSYFQENPRPKPTDMFPTFPSKAGQERRRRPATPNAPVRGPAPALQGETDFSSIFKSGTA